MAQKEFTTGEMMKTLDFFVLIACFFACGTGGMYISATYKNYGEDVLPNSDDLFFTTVGSVGSLCNGTSRVFWGLLADRIGAFRTLLIMSVAFPLVLFVYSTYSNTETLYGGCVAALFWCYGGNFSLFPTICATLFGTKNNGTNYGMVFIWFGSITAVLLYAISVVEMDYSDINFVVVGVATSGASLVAYLCYRAPR